MKYALYTRQKISNKHKSLILRWLASHAETENQELTEFSEKLSCTGKYTILLIMIFLLSGCLNTSLSPKDETEVHEPITIEDPKKCKQVGGKWSNTGPWHGKKDYCILRAKDAGKRCNDHKQCQYGCYVNNKYYRLGEKAEGECKANNVPLLGCFQDVKKGKAGHHLCI